MLIKLLKRVVSAFILLVTIFFLGLILLNEYKSQLLSEFLGRPIMVGHIPILPMFRGSLFVKEITLFDERWGHLKTFRVEMLEINWFTLLMNQPTVVAIEELAIYYHDDTTGERLLSVVVDVQSKLEAIFAAPGTEGERRIEVVIEEIVIYGGNNIFESDTLRLHNVKVEWGVSSSNPVEIFKELNVIYHSPLRSLSYPKILKFKYDKNLIDISLFATYSFYRDVYQMSLVNVGYSSRGAQFGLFNYLDDSSTWQIGIINICEDHSSSQIGLLNYANKEGSLQFGILNVNPEALLPVTILVNW
jgi:hypothetical protein